MKLGSLALLAFCLVACEPFSPSNPDADASGPVGDAGVVGFRRAVTISPPPLSGPVENVPVALQLANDAHLRDNARADGSDLIVLGDSGPLDLDIEFFDSASGTLVAWIVLPVLPVDGLNLSLVYGGDPAATANPWQGIAELVWHMEAIAADTVSDHSPTELDGTRLQGTIAPVAGPTGDGLEFTDAVLGVPSNADLDGGVRSFTVSMWFRETEAVGPVDNGFFNGGPLVLEAGYQIAFGTGNWIARIQDALGSSVTVVLGSQAELGPTGWHHLGLVVDRELRQVSGFRDGNIVATIDLDAGFGSLTNNIQLGRVGGFGDVLRGAVDEVRFLTTAVSADFIAVDFANGMGTLVEIGAPEISN